MYADQMTDSMRRAMGETDRRPRECMFPPGHTSVESQLRPSHVKRKFISLLSS